MKTKFLLFLAFVFVLTNAALSQATHNLFPFAHPVPAASHKTHKTLPASLKPRTRGQVSKPGNAKNYTWRDTLDGSWDNNVDGLGVLIHDNNEVFSYDVKGNLTTDLITDTTGVNVNRMLSTYNGFNQLTNSTSQTWNGTDWTNTTQDIYTYDALGNQTLDLSQAWSGGNWVNSNQTIDTFNVKGKLTHDLSQTWNGIGWDNEEQTLITYDAQGNSIQELDMFGFGISWDTAFGSRDTYTYDGNNHVTGDISQVYMTGGWVNFSKFVYTVSSNGEWLTATEQDWVSNAWANASHVYNITWKDFGTLTPLTYILQGFSTGSWQDSLKYSATYDSYGGFVQLTQVMMSGSWVNSEQFSEEYDSHYNFTGLTVEGWQGGNHQIIEQENALYTYSPNNDVLRIVIKLWNPDVGEEVNWTRTDYSNFQYFTVSGVENVNAEKQISVYPNPTSNQINIAFNNADFNVASISIFNFLGQNVMETNDVNTTSSAISIPVNQFPAGIYFVRLTGKDQSTVTKKFVKE